MIKPHYKYLLIEPIVEEKTEDVEKKDPLSTFYTDLVKNKGTISKVYEVVKIADYSESCEQLWKPYIGSRAIVNSNQVERFNIGGKEIYLVSESAVFATLDE